MDVITVAAEAAKKVTEAFTNAPAIATLKVCPWEGDTLVWLVSGTTCWGVPA